MEGDFKIWIERKEEQEESEVEEERDRERKGKGDGERGNMGDASGTV